MSSSAEENVFVDKDPHLVSQEPQPFEVEDRSSSQWSLSPVDYPEKEPDETPGLLVLDVPPPALLGGFFEFSFEGDPQGRNSQEENQEGVALVTGSDDAADDLLDYQPESFSELFKNVKFATLPIEQQRYPDPVPYDSINRNLEGLVRAPTLYFPKWANYKMVTRMLQAWDKKPFVRSFEASGCFKVPVALERDGRLVYCLPNPSVILPRDVQFRTYSRGESQRLEADTSPYLAMDKRIVLLSIDVEGEAVFLQPNDDFPKGTVLIRLDTDFQKDFLILDSPPSEATLLDHALQFRDVMTKILGYEIGLEMVRVPGWSTSGCSPACKNYFATMNQGILPPNLTMDTSIEQTRTELLEFLRSEGYAELAQEFADLPIEEFIKDLDELEELFPHLFSSKMGAIGSSAERVSFEELPGEVLKAFKVCAFDPQLELLKRNGSATFLMKDHSLPTLSVDCEFYPQEVLTSFQKQTPGWCTTFTDATRTLSEMMSVVNRLVLRGHAHIVRGRLKGMVNTCVSTAPPLRPNKSIKGNQVFQTSWKELQTFEVDTEIALCITLERAHKNDRIYAKDVNRVIIHEFCRMGLRPASLVRVKCVSNTLTINQNLMTDNLILDHSILFPFQVETKAVMNEQGEPLSDVELHPPSCELSGHPLNIFESFPETVSRLAKHYKAKHVRIILPGKALMPGFDVVRLKIGYNPGSYFPLPLSLPLRMPVLEKETPEELYAALTFKGTVHTAIQPADPGSIPIPPIKVQPRLKKTTVQPQQSKSTLHLKPSSKEKPLTKGNVATHSELVRESLTDESLGSDIRPLWTGVWASCPQKKRGTFLPFLRRAAHFGKAYSRKSLQSEEFQGFHQRYLIDAFEGNPDLTAKPNDLNRRLSKTFTDSNSPPW